MKRVCPVARSGARPGQIWKHINKENGRTTADRIESVLREKIVFLSEFPFAGHTRPDLTRAAVRFFAVYSFLIVYRPGTKPLQVVSILHGRRDVGSVLEGRL